MPGRTSQSEGTVMMEPRKFQMTKYGLGEDPRGRHVSFTLGQREFLGEVISAYFDSVTGTARLKVRHFNGEPWPQDPPVRSVLIIG